MKNIFILLSTLLFVVFLFSCDTVEEETNYTYAIDSVWWSDVIDGNGDGYPKFERLNFNVHLKENATQKIMARVYYKLKEASDFSFYAFSDDKQILGESVDNSIFVSIGGLPNKELQRGYYDFTIELYQANQSDVKAEPDSTQLVTLSNRPFELSEFDNTFTMDISWMDEYDRNNNGYARHSTMVVDVNNNEDDTRNLDAKFYYKLSDSEDEFKLYFERNNFPISGDSDNDTITVKIGDSNGELEKGEYDFRVELFEKGKDRLLAFEDMENKILSKRKFETEDDDSYYYTISNVWWSDSTDLDSDNYTSMRKIHFDVDVDKNEKRTLFAKIFMRPYAVDSTDYETLYDSTANFNITGTSTSDAFATWIGKDTTKLDSNKFDILISVYDALSDSLQAEATISSFSHSILKLQTFETASQDSL